MAVAPDLYVNPARFFYFPKANEPVLVVENTIAREGHPILKSNPDQFVPLEVTFDVKETRATGRRAGGG